MQLLTLNKLKDYNLFSDKPNKLILRAIHISKSEIKIVLEKNLPQDAVIQLYNHCKEQITNLDIISSKVKNEITITGTFEPDANYILKINNEQAHVILNPEINGILDTYYYSDNIDFGVSIKNNTAFFKLWTPPAVRVELLLFDRNQNKIIISKPFLFNNTKPGIWEYNLNPKDIGLKNLEGIYYQNKISAYGKEKIALDPYAKSMAVFDSASDDKIGKGAIINIKSDKANPPSFKRVYSNYKFIANDLDIIVYEINIRDFTIQPGTVDEKVAGTFKGLIEKIDYLKELGITHVQLMPVNKAYTQNELDRTYTGKSAKESNYNWGYDPMNYFTIEGRYSTNPENPYTRIYEFKEMIQALHNAGIGVILDVVFNHTYIADTFENIAPGCYYRLTDDYRISGHTGAGASIESRRKQIRKFIIDVLKFYVQEYHIDGFRFDLMSFTDKETIRQIRKEVGLIYNPNNENELILQGEAWNFTDLKKDAVIKTDFESLNIGIFNDSFRDSLAGNGHQHGFIHGNTGETSRLASAITSGIKYFDQKNLPFNKEIFFNAYNLFAKVPSDCLNFISVHDGLTLWDKLNLTVKDESKVERLQLMKLAAAILFTSQGKIILHSGDELLRSKPKAEFDKENHRAMTSENIDYEEETNYFHENSYSSNDFTNMIRWDRLTNDYSEFAKELFDYYKGLILMRRSIPAFRYLRTESMLKGLKFNSQNSDSHFHTFYNQNIKKLTIIFKNGKPNNTLFIVGEIHKHSENPMNNPYYIKFNKKGIAKITFSREQINNFDLNKWDRSRNLNIKLVKTTKEWNYPEKSYTTFGYNSISPESINEHFETEIDLNIRDFKIINTYNQSISNNIAYTLNNTIEKEISANFSKVDFKQIVVIHNPDENKVKVEFKNLNLKKYFVIADGNKAGITKLTETKVIIEDNYVLVPRKSTAVIACI
ncbi:MAG: hypothetical protein K8R54_03250 [Bacteroidales bacterium]|nr:hypothetical protein [Bacteroidales bacterium]